MAGAPAPGRARGNSSERGSSKLRNHGDVLVATATQVDQDEFVRSPAAFHHPRNRVSALESRQNAFQAREGRKCFQRLAISHGFIQYAPRVFQVSVLGTDARVIEPGRDAVRLLYLAIRILQQITHAAMKHAWPTRAERGGMLVRLGSFPGGFDANQLDGLIFEKRGENPHRVRSASDACE